MISERYRKGTRCVCFNSRWRVSWFLQSNRTSIWFKDTMEKTKGWKKSHWNKWRRQRGRERNILPERDHAAAELLFRCTYLLSAHWGYSVKYFLECENINCNSRAIYTDIAIYKSFVIVWSLSNYGRANHEANKII